MTSVSQRHGSADPDPDPDPHQNVMDPQHWSAGVVGISSGEFGPEACPTFGYLVWFGLVGWME